MIGYVVTAYWAVQGILLWAVLHKPRKKDQDDR